MSYKDDASITPDPTLFFTNGKLEFFFIPRLAVALNGDDG